MKKYKKYVIAETAVLVGIFLVLWMFAPSLGGVEVRGRTTFFEFRNAHTILIDDNPDFTSPKEIEESEMILEPGKYYWKAFGILGESRTGNFSIDSEVIINMRIENKSVWVKNKGNVPVNATSENKKTGAITGKVVVKEGEEKVVEKIDEDNLSLQINIEQK